MKTQWLDEQQEAIKQRGNLVVSASAGSGKTAVLVAKIVDMLLSDNTLNLNRIVVVTFTKLAAAEMKEKLAEKLSEKMREEPKSRERLSKQLAALPFCNITTIDGYCNTLFKQYFNELGEDSHFEIIEDDESDQLFRLAVNKVLADHYDKGEDEFASLLECVTENRRTDGIVNIIKRIYDFWEVQPDSRACVMRATEEQALPFEKRRAAKWMLESMRRRARQIYDLCNNLKNRAVASGAKAFDKLFPSMLSSAERLTSVVDFKVFSDQLSRLDPMPAMVAERNLKTDGDRQLYPEIKSLKAALSDFIKGLRSAYGGDYYVEMEKENISTRFNTLLFKLAEESRDAYAKAKRAAGKLDYSDIEHAVLRLLSDETRKKDIRDSIDYIFLDEYQDTNYLQEEIIRGLTRGDNMFMVGDVKQCIYQFRDVQPQIFLDKYRSYSNNEGGKSLVFNFNWRSDKEILDFVNAVFSETMTSSLGGVDYKDEAQLNMPPQRLDSPKIDTPLEKVKVVWIVQDSACKQPSVKAEDYDIRLDSSRKEPSENAEALYIAGYIKSAVGRPFYDQKLKAERPLTYDDIVVLTRTNSAAVALSAVLRKEGLPVFQRASESLFYASDRKCLIDYLRVLDNSHNDIPLVSALLSPLGGFNEEELYEIRCSDTDKPFWETFFAYKGNQTLQTKVQRFATAVKRHRLYAASVDVFALINRVVADFDYDAVLLGLPFGSERTERHNMFVNSLRGKSYASTLANFIGFAAEQDFKVQAPSADDRAVTVMTVHASKGLEFPVVVLANLDYVLPSDSDVILLDRDLGVATNWYNAQTKTKGSTWSSEIFKAKKAVAEKEAELRLLYVALTRAQSHLLTIGYDKSSGKGVQFADSLSKFGGWLRFASERNAEIRTVTKKVNLEDIRPCDVPNNAVTAAVKDTVPQYDFSQLSYGYPHAAATVAGAKYSVSTLNHTQQTEQRVRPLPRAANDESDSCQLGTDYHAVLECVNLAARDAAAIDEAIDSLLIGGVLTESRAKALDRNLLQRVLSLPVFSEAAGAKCEREKSFMLYLPLSAVQEDSEVTDKVLIQGIIDMVIEKDGEAILVDYKYTSADGESAAERYKKQLEIYAVAIEKLSGLRIRHKILVLLRSAEQYEII